ncbi:MAG: DUF4358 domain-containing protein [Tissierellia bacterium]|nr:DUF4358 domain-containing protein [Tissierellia bacterium]
MRVRFRIVTVLAIVIAMVFSACGKGESGGAANADEKTDETISMEGIVASIMRDFSLEKLELNKELLESLYGLDSDELEDYRLWVPTKNILANEMLLVKTSDATTVEKVKKAMEKRSNDVADIFKSYSPEQYDLATKSVIAEKGNYIIFIIDEDARGIMESFKKSF